jgi:hypothetical protein
MIYTVITNKGNAYEVRAISENAAWRKCLRLNCAADEWVVELRYKA